MKKSITACLLAAALAAGVPAVALARTAMMEPPHPVELTDAKGQPASADAVHAAILAGAAKTGWIVRSDEPGRVELSTLVRSKHTVVVAAVYQAGSVRFDYVSSVNMNYDQRRKGEVIHPNYMAWRARLEQAVNAALVR